MGAGGCPRESPYPPVSCSRVIRILLFVGVPIAELAVLAAIENQIGLGWTLGLIVVTGVIGARLAFRQGRSVWAAFRARLAAGQMPGAELAHGAMVLVGAAFLLTPGVITDVAGFLLMIPWFRELLRVRFVGAFRMVIR